MDIRVFSQTKERSLSREAHARASSIYIDGRSGHPPTPNLNETTMKLATLFVCLLSVAGWISLSSATPFMPNFFKQGKDAFFQAMGGDSNPFVKGMKDMEKMFGTDDWQQQFHDMIANGMEQASGPAREQMEQWMGKFQEMTESGATKAQFEEFAKQMKSKMGGQ